MALTPSITSETGTTKLSGITLPPNSAAGKAVASLTKQWEQYKHDRLRMDGEMEAPEEEGPDLD